MCNLTDRIGSTSLIDVKGVGVDVAWTLYFCFCGVTQDCMSSVLKMLFLFWLAVMCLLSSLDEIYVRVKLLVNDVWKTDDDKPGFLSVGVKFFDQLF